MVFSSLSVFSQNGSSNWNRSTATYTNPIHKITWKLIDELDWVNRPILEKGTLLKVRNEETSILVKLHANKYAGENGDAWDLYSEKEDPQLEKMHKQQAQHNGGMTYIGTKTIKSQMCGIHALKKRVDMKKYIPEQNQDAHCIEIGYIFCKGNHVYIASVMCLVVLEEEVDLFERLATQIFNGFNITE